MKNNIIKILAVIFITTLTSCDFVTVPEQSGTTQQTGTTVQRKVLLEDYTGHKCTACPQAAVTANNLLQTNGDKLIVIGIHAGFFANPQVASTSQYLADFRTTGGDAYDTFFGVSDLGNPNGLINRKDYTPSTTTHVKPFGSWATEVATELAKPAMAKIAITNTYNAGTKTLGCNVQSTFLSDTLSGGPYKLIVVVTQDSIVADQLDAGVYVPTYTHRHVLRDNINGTWGENVASSGSISLTTPITKNYTYVFPTNYPSSGGVNATNCDINHFYVVAFIYNDISKEVIQVEEAKVAP